MGLFSQLRAGRADDRELGTSLWRQDHDRFRRAVDRFHQVLEGTESDEVYALLLPSADRLGEMVPRVREIGARCHRLHPVDGDDVPGDLEPVHRALSRAANDAAAAAQAAAMSRFSETPGIVAKTVERRVGIVADRVAEAVAALP